MQLRTFRAATMQEALTLVRRELGPDAAVLHTCSVRSHWLGVLPGPRQIEVTASRGVNVPSRLPTGGGGEKPAAPALPLRPSVRAAEEVQLAERIGHLDLLLLNTAGRSPEDEVRTEELETFLADARRLVRLILAADRPASTLTKLKSEISNLKS